MRLFRIDSRVTLIPGFGCTYRRTKSVAYVMGLPVAWWSRMVRT